MAKSKKAAPATKATATVQSSPPTSDDQTAKRLAELKSEGNTSFARGDYSRALAIYEDALKVAASGSERADFHNNRAACFIGLKRFKDAVKECNSALEASPGSFKALQRRAKAHEQQGAYADALADLATITTAGLATDDTREAERRIKAMAGKSLNTTGAAANGTVVPAGPPAARAARAGAANGPASAMFTAKVSLGDDTRLIHFTVLTTYYELMQQARSKFPGSGPFALKFLDKEGDLIALTCREDIHSALSMVLEAYQRQMQASQQGHGAKPSLPNTMPPSLRLSAIPVPTEADVPKAPPSEDPTHLQALQAAKAKEEQVQEPPVALEPWLLDFASLFVQMTGLDLDKHVELHNLGWEASTRAMDAAIHHDKAAELFTRATDAFRDVTATGLTAWGNVHQMKGTRLLENAVRAGTPVSEVEEEAMGEWAQAERRFNEALGYNADHFDAVCALAQLEFERVKFRAGYHLPNTVPPEGSASSPEEQQAATTAATRKALALLAADKVLATRPLLEQCMGFADRALLLAPAMDVRAQEPGRQPQPKQADGTDFTHVAQVKVLKGNFLFEWSQMLSAVGEDWKAPLDEARALFEGSGCPAKDIRSALKNHVCADQLDLGPEPEEEAAAKPAAKPEAPKASAPKAPAPEAKGLPSLEVKKKKAADA